MNFQTRCFNWIEGMRLRHCYVSAIIITFVITTLFPSPSSDGRCYTVFWSVTNRQLARRLFVKVLVRIKRRKSISSLCDDKNREKCCESLIVNIKLNALHLCQRLIFIVTAGILPQPSFTFRSEQQYMLYMVYIYI